MLLKAEKTLNYDDGITEMMQEDILKAVRNDLAHEIAQRLLDSDLMKTELWYNDHPAIGEYVRVRVTVRAYNPDD